MRKTQPFGRVQGEEIEQARLIKWSHKKAVRDLMPELRWLHHSPNGGQRSSMAGAQMKALGTKKGWPDLILPVAHKEGKYPGLVIEMKSATGRASVEQIEWHGHFRRQGWAVWIARSAQEAREQLCLYLGMPLDQAPPLED